MDNIGILYDMSHVDYFICIVLGSASILSPNIVANPSYSGPTTAATTYGAPSPHHLQTSPHNIVPLGAEHRGHLV